MEIDINLNEKIVWQMKNNFYLELEEKFSSVKRAQPPTRFFDNFREAKKGLQFLRHALQCVCV